MNEYDDLKGPKLYELSLDDRLKNISENYNKVMLEITKDQEEFWNSLTPENQLKAFCAVVRRIHKGEIEDKGSYRYVLYNTFQFGSESYAQAQDAGYLSIHNSIYTPEEERNLLIDFAKFHGLDEQAVTDYYNEKF
jgi:hypothetical protein